MNENSHIERVLSTWMADGPTAIPDRVVDVVAVRIGVQPQRRTWPFLRRTNMTTQIKLIAALAAVLVVGVVGYNLLPGPGGPGGPSTAPTTAPTAAPVPTAQATPAVTGGPSASAVFPSWYTNSERNGAGSLGAGSHATRAFRPGFTFSAPEGWVNGYDEAGFYQLFPDTPANQAQFARSGDLAQSISIGPHNSPYFFCNSLENNQGATAAEIAAAIAANEALATTGKVDVAIGGLTGKQLDVRFTGTCPPSPDDQPGLNQLLKEERVRVILLDTPDRRVLVAFVISNSSAANEAFLAEAMPIVESFEFDLG